MIAILLLASILSINYICRLVAFLPCATCYAKIEVRTCYTTFTTILIWVWSLGIVMIYTYASPESCCSPVYFLLAKIAKHVVEHSSLCKCFINSWVRMDFEYLPFANLTLSFGLGSPDHFSKLFLFRLFFITAVSKEPTLTSSHHNRFLWSHFSFFLLCYPFSFFSCLLFSFFSGLFFCAE
jgi:hypothetical protein